MTDPAAELKAHAAETAAAEVRSGMAVGLGTGSTAIFATRRIGARLAAGELRDVVGYATSDETRRAAAALGIPLLALELDRRLDVTIDGADEVDPALNLIKGGGGAHLREKIVAQASDRELIVVDESKLSAAARDPPCAPARGAGVRLGVAGPLRRVARRDGDGAHGSRRAARTAPTRATWCSTPRSGRSPTPPRSRHGSRTGPGIVAHGLFLGLTSEVFVAGPDGVRRLTPP